MLASYPCAVVPRMIDISWSGDGMYIAIQDTWGAHGSTLLKYFMSEGLACQQQLLHVHDGYDADGLLSQLPKLVEKSEKGIDPDGSTSASSSATDATELKIAWQYKRCACSTSCPGHACTRRWKHAACTDATLCDTMPCTYMRACQTRLM